MVKQYQLARTDRLPVQQLVSLLPVRKPITLLGTTLMKLENVLWRIQ